MLACIPNLDGFSTPDHPGLGDGGGGGADASTEPDGSAGTVSDAGSSPGITFVAVSSAKVSSQSSITVNLAQAPAEGDLLLAIIYDGRGASDPQSVVTPPAGWQVQTQRTYWQTLYTVASANAGTTFTFETTAAGTLPDIAALVAVYRGVDATHPFDGTQLGACPVSATDSTCTAGSVTTTHANTRLVVLSGVDGATGAGWTMPSGIVMRGDLGLVAVADTLQAAPGPTGPVTGTHTVTGWASSVNLVALVPRP